MTDTTIEAILNRLDKLEQRVASLSTQTREKDWQSVFGMFEGSEFQQKIDAEIQAMRNAEWQRIQDGLDE